jgi:hypothetical protein
MRNAVTEKARTAMWQAPYLSQRPNDVVSSNNFPYPLANLRILQLLLGKWLMLEKYVATCSVFMRCTTTIRHRVRRGGGAAHKGLIWVRKFRPLGGVSTQGRENLWRG